MIANNAGDRGGKSYGTYQFASNMGTVQPFVNSLRTTFPAGYNALRGKKVGSAAFDKAWRSLGSSKAFGDAQHNYIKKQYFDPMIGRMRKNQGINLTSKPLAVQNVIWSLSVQHGVGGASTVLKNAGINNRMSDAQIINRIYDERSKVDRHFAGNSARIKQSVRNRFVRERKDALAQLRA